MKKKALAFLLACLVSCNFASGYTVFAEETTQLETISSNYDDYRQHTVGLLSYTAPEGWVLDNDSSESNSIVFHNATFDYLTIYPVEVPSESAIDFQLELSRDLFHDKEGYIELSADFVETPLGTRGYYAEYSYQTDDVSVISLAYSIYYEGIVYRFVLTANINRYEEALDLILEVQNSLAPVEILNDTESVKNIQEELNQKGYDCGTPDGIAGPKTEAAIRKYQEDNLEIPTGKITKSLHYSLIGQTAAEQTESEFQTESSPQTESEVQTEYVENVWIPSSGTKYHRRSSCSNMNSPQKVTKTQAEQMGYTPCKKCF